MIQLTNQYKDGFRLVKINGIKFWCAIDYSGIYLYNPANNKDLFLSSNILNIPEREYYREIRKGCKRRVIRLPKTHVVRMELIYYLEYIEKLYFSYKAVA